VHRTDLSERVIAVERKLIAHADVAVKGGRPGERAACNSAPSAKACWGDRLRGHFSRRPEARIPETVASGNNAEWSCNE
jgi:hypothetical protein